jgi:hypothetical protein
MRDEERVEKVLLFAFPGMQITRNKSYGRGECSRRHYRPDFLFADTFMPAESAPFRVIVECDEHKHSGQAYSCDVKRMSEISADLGCAVKFIRFNPNSQQTRYSVLIEETRRAMQDPLEKLVTNFVARYLFY